MDKQYRVFINCLWKQTKVGYHSQLINMNELENSRPMVMDSDGACIGGCSVGTNAHCDQGIS